MKSKRDFILETLLPYKLDPSTCAIDSSGYCEYLTEDGRKCAIGKHMLPGIWQKYSRPLVALFMEYNKEEMLTKEANDMNLKNIEWYAIQHYHDSIAKKHAIISKEQAVINIETTTGLKFPELHFTE